MKVRFIQWFVRLILQDMQYDRCDNEEKKKIYQRIRKQENTKTECEKKI